MNNKVILQEIKDILKQGLLMLRKCIQIIAKIICKEINIIMIIDSTIAMYF